MSERGKNILIGLFVLGAIIATIWTILFLEPQVGDGKKMLTVRFTDISGVNVGTRVNLAGRPVGEVIEVDVIKNAREEPKDTLGRVYYYQLKLKVDSSVDVFNTDEVAIKTTGLLGEKSIAIIPKAPKKDQIPKNISKQVIYGNSIEPFENALVQFSEMADEVETLVKDVDEWFMENSENLTKTVDSLTSAMDQTDILIQNVNEKQLVDSVKESIDEMNANLKIFHSMLVEAQDNETMTKINQIVDNVADASKSLNTDGKEIFHNVNLITQDIADGTGSIGKMIKNDDLYLRIVAIMSKMDTLMNDINHYGLLFGYDKKWQRMRTKRANLLESLKTPEQFRSYYETEVDSITTALSRISVLLDKAKEPKEKQRIMKSPRFKRDFLELMSQVEEMLDSLKLYNEELIKKTAYK